jgi:hypothetical protein
MKPSAGATSKYGRLLGVRDAAAYAGIGPHFLRALIRRRELAVVRNANGRLLGVYELSIREWQDSRITPPSGRPTMSQQMVDAQLETLRMARFPTSKEYVFVPTSRFD